MKKHTHTLTIAGFDGSGGAGIQADLKTFSALGCYGMSVLTALPVQNTQGVKSIYSIPDKCIEEQLQAVLEDIEVDAIKIGMLHRPEIIILVAKFLKHAVVLDPVMVAKSGDKLLNDNAIATMKEKLFPSVTLLTPNLPEASVLLNRTIKTKEEMAKAAEELAKMGPQAVVVKGGHLTDGPCDDCLYTDGQVHWFSSPRITTKNTHGTGCTFSAAATAYLAKGFPLVESVHLAKQYLSQCIAAGAHYTVGQGNGPVHHFFSLWERNPSIPLFKE